MTTEDPDPQNVIRDREVSATSARRELAECSRGAEEAERRALDLRQLARTARGGPETDEWLRRAEWFDQAVDAHRRRAAQLRRYVEQLGAAPTPKEAA